MDRFCSKSIGSLAAFLLLPMLSLITCKVFPGTSGPADTTSFTSGVQLPVYNDSIAQFNRFGSFGLFTNGIRAATRTNNSNFLAGYSYRNFDGYRVHSSEYFHNFDIALTTVPSANTSLLIGVHYINGRVKQPGSLTKSEFDSACFQADPRAINRDENRITKKGQFDVTYNVLFGKSFNHKIEISGNGTIEYFERVTKEFKITTRYIMGLTARYVYNCRFWHRNSEFSVGGNLFHQPERKEEYENWGGQKSDNLEQIEVEKTSISGCYISENFELVEKKLFVFFTGRYDHVIYSVAEERSPSRSDTKRYHALTPEIELHYEVIPAITIFTSCEVNFKNPTDKELESPVPGLLYNNDLRPQTSTILKAGITGTLAKKDPAVFFNRLQFEAIISRSFIENEIVRYEIFGDEFYRNASKTNRFRFGVHGKLDLYKELTFEIAYAFSEYVYKSYLARSWEPVDSAGTLGQVNRDFADNAEPNVPRNTLNLALAFKQPIGRKTGIFARLSYVYAGGLWVDDANSDKTGAYNLVNAMLGLDMKFGHFTFTVSGGVNNILNEVYAGNTNTNSADKRFYNAGSPRDFIGSVNFGYVF